MGALSSWWVEALQHYDQQRMWMQLGPPPSQWKLPSRSVFCFEEFLYFSSPIPRFMRLVCIKDRVSDGVFSCHSPQLTPRVACPSLSRVSLAYNMSVSVFWDMSRFERRYAPRELSEFDALLAHDFMHPVNLGTRDPVLKR